VVPEHTVPKLHEIAIVELAANPVAVKVTTVPTGPAMMLSVNEGCTMKFTVETFPIESVAVKTWLPATAATSL
jgi:hypothetical protein